MNAATEQSQVYVFGDSDAELQRLMYQSRFFGDLTEQVLRQAGLAPGMRVLDIGCGAGDVAFLAARFVGPTGHVLGIDKSPTAIALARKRAAQAGLEYVTFAVADLEHFHLHEPIDALVGRLILMYLTDPAAVLRRLAKQVRPGGLVVFHEMDVNNWLAVSDPPLYTACRAWLQETFRRARIEINMGSKLHATFRQADLPYPQLIMNGRVEAGPDSPGYEYIAQTVRSVLPMMERLGVVPADVIDIDTLAMRLREEVLSTGTVMHLPPLIGAWAPKPV